MGLQEQLRQWLLECPRPQSVGAGFLQQLFLNACQDWRERTGVPGFPLLVLVCLLCTAVGVLLALTSLLKRIIR